MLQIVIYDIIFLDHALKTKAYLKSTISQLDTLFIFIVFLCYYYFLKQITKTSNMSIYYFKNYNKKNIFNQAFSHKFESQSMAFHHLKKNQTFNESFNFANYVHKTIHKCKTLI
jgi:hypothetical protein